MPDQSIKEEYFPTAVEASSVISEWLYKHFALVSLFFARHT